MANSVVDLRCPGCGGAVSIADKECVYCGRPVVITTFNSVYEMPLSEVNRYAATYRSELERYPNNAELNNSIAMCYLKLKLYDKAQIAFEKAFPESFDNSETFFYAAVCLLKGKKAFLAARVDIDKAVEYINTAISIEPRGIYYYFLAYIKYDYFERKYLNTTPNYSECAQKAVEIGTSECDKKMLFDILGVSKPGVLD